MNRSFCKIAYSLSVLVLLLACQDKKREENVIKIGAILPLTGNMAYLGESIKKGMDMACAHLNNENTIKIEIIYGDSKGDNKTGIDLSKIHLLIVSVFSFGLIDLSCKSSSIVILFFSFPTF